MASIRQGVKRNLSSLSDDKENCDSTVPTSCKKPSPWKDQSENDHCMKVYVRVRPPNEREMKAEVKKIVDVVGTQMIVFDPKVDEDEYYYHGKKYKEIGSKPNKNKTFYFDRVFDENSSNIDVFESATKHFVESLLDGFNCSVFAYGATGSGKTHTMLGTVENPGVVVFTTMELFRVIESRSEKEKLELSVSYFEVYNEVVYDLLGPTLGKPLSIRDDPNKGVTVSNLSVHYPENSQNLIDMLESGSRNRSQNSTDANSESSRSHAVFQITLKNQDFSTNQQMSIKISKMSLIDLAGSERASVAYKANRAKLLQREGGNINKSLLALGNCINALTNNSKRKGPGYVPYRNSKLTLLLKDSLGGTCHTAMVATVNSTSVCFEETFNTLSYANRAKGIKLNLKRNSMAFDLEPRHFTQAIESLSQRNIELSEENILLKAELTKLRNQFSAAPTNPIVTNGDSVNVLNSYKNQLDDLFETRLKLRRKMLETVSNLKKIELKLILRQLDAERNRILSNGEAKSDQLASLFSQKVHYTDQKSSLEASIIENECVMENIESEIKSRVCPGDWLIEAYFRDQKMTLEFKDKSFGEQYIVDVANEILNRLDSNEELLIDAMELIRHIQMLLNGMNRLSNELNERFVRIQKRVQGKKSVVWRDADRKDKQFFFKRSSMENILTLPTFTSLPKTPKITSNTRELTSFRELSFRSHSGGA